MNIPETSAKQASFLLTSVKAGQEEKVVLDKTLDLTTNSGIVAYTLPTDFPGLETSTQYRWRLSLLCDPTGEDRSGDANTGGWIAKEQPTPEIAKELLQSQAGLDRIAVYANHGYWQDSLKGLLDLRAANPQDQDLASEWLSILQSDWFRVYRSKTCVRTEF